jgi:hypothetical protein
MSLAVPVPLRLRQVLLIECFAFFLADPLYLALIFGAGDVFGKMILR